MTDFNVSFKPSIRSDQFTHNPIFPRKNNANEMIGNYFKSDDGFVDLHNELHKLNLNG